MSQFAVTLSVDGNVNVVQFVDDQLKTLQDAVGGYIERIVLAPDLTMWVNEDGRNSGLPFNQAATSILVKYKGGTTFIVGPVAFTGGTDPSGETAGISEQDITQLKTYAAMSKVD